MKLAFVCFSENLNPIYNIVFSIKYVLSPKYSIHSASLEHTIYELGLYLNRVELKEVIHLDAISLAISFNYYETNSLT